MSITLLAVFAIYAIALTIALARAGHRTRAHETTAPPPRPPEKVLIVGATGGTGRELVAQALGRGYSVTALARDPSKVTIEHPRLRVARGDVLDAASVEAAMRGHDAVLCALGHRRYFQPTRILSDGTRNILSGMKACGVRRLVCETSLGIGDSAGRLGLYYTFFVIPVILPFYFWDKTRQERAIAGSEADWVIVRPGVLTKGAKRNRVTHGSRVGSFVWTVRIARADVASFMLDQLVSNDCLRNAPGIRG